MAKFSKIIIFIFCCLILSPNVGNADKPRIVILDFQLGAGKQTLKKEVKRDFPDMLRRSLVESDMAKVLERNEWATLWLEKSRAEELPEYFNQNTAVEIGKNVLANYVILGKITQYGEIVEVSARVVDIKSSTIVTEKSVNFSKNEPPHSYLLRLSRQLSQFWQEKSIADIDGQIVEKTIAIACVENLSPNNKGEYDWIGNGVMSTFNSKFDLLEGKISVARRERVITLCGRDVAFISDQLSVDFVLLGDYQILGGLLRLNVQVVEGRSGKIIAATSRTDQVEKIFSIQDSLIFDITEKINIFVSAEEKRALTQHRTLSLTAYEYFSKGLQYFDDKAFEDAIRLFQKSLRIDPNYLDARYYLGLSYSKLSKQDQALEELRAALGDSLYSQYGKVAWTFRTNGKFAGTDLVTRNNNVYFSPEAKSIYSINMSTGNFKWRFETEEKVQSNLFIDEWGLYFVSGGNATFAIDTNTGKVVWEFLPPTRTNITTDPVIHGEFLYLGGMDGSVFILEKTTGKPIRTFNFHSKIHKLTKFNSTLFVLVGDKRQTLYSIDALSQRINWQSTFLNEALSVQVEDRLVFITDGKSQINAYDIDSGKLEWTYKTQLESPITILVHEDLIITSSRLDSKVLAVEKRKGKVAWRFTGNGKGVSSLVSHDSTIFYTSTGPSKQGTVYALDSKYGSIKWKLKLDGLLEEVTAYKDHVFVKAGGLISFIRGDDSYLYSIKNSTGLVDWQYKFSQIPYSKLLVSNDALYVGNRDGKLYAFGISASKIGKVRACDVWYAIGNIYEQIDHFKDSIRAWKRCLAINSGYGKVYKALAQLYTRKKMGVHAIEAWQKYLRLVVNDENEYAKVKKLIKDIAGLKWDFYVGQSGGFDYISRPSPLIRGDNLFFAGYDNAVFALNKENGNVVWTSQFKEDSEGGVVSGLTLSDNVLCFGTEQGVLYCLDSTNGEARLEYRVDQGIRRTPSTNRDNVFFCTKNGHLYSIRKDNGRKQWDTDLSSFVVMTPLLEMYFEEPGICWMDPLLYDQQLYAGVGEHLFSLDSMTGKINWHFTTNNMVKSTPIIKGNILYLGIDDGFLYELDAGTGKLLRKHEIATEVDNWLKSVRQEKTYNLGGPGMLSSSPVLAKDILYVGATDHTLYAFDIRSRKIIWRYEAEKDIGTPGIGGDLVFFGSGQPLFQDKHVFAVNSSDGSLQWAYKTEGDVLGKPSVYENMVYLYSTDGHLYAFDIPLMADWDPAYDQNFHFKTGIRYFNNGEFEKAADLFNQIIEEDPNNEDVHQRLSDCYMALGNHEANIERLEKFLSKNNGQTPLIARMGLSFSSIGNYDRAVASFKKVKALGDKKSKHVGSYYLASTYLLEGKVNEAMKEAQEVIKNTNDMALQRGALLLISSMQLEHLFLFEYAYNNCWLILSADPKDEGAQNCIVEAAFTTGRFKAAIENSQKFQQDILDGTDRKIAMIFYELASHLFLDEIRASIGKMEKLSYSYRGIKTFSNTWNFRGTKHFIINQESPRGEILIQIIRVLEEKKSDETMKKLDDLKIQLETLQSNPKLNKF